MTTQIAKNIVILGHRTSVRMESEMWDGIYCIARREECKPNFLFDHIQDTKHEKSTFSSALRMFVFNYYRNAATEEGHEKAGHGLMFAR